MPRPLRLEYINAWYHVMNRGASHQAIYLDDKHKLLFLELLEEATLFFGIKVHSYCLMENHYHLLLSTPRANLAQAMRHINGLYTLKFNRLVKRDGPLLRGRYKAIVVDQDSYLLQVSRYIHLNPVAAKLCETPGQYQWSSCKYFFEPNNKPIWLVTDEILSLMQSKNAAFNYSEFLNQGVDSPTAEFYIKKHLPVIIGKKAFKQKLLGNLAEDKIESSRTDYNKTRNLPSIEEVSAICAKYFAVSEANLHVANRGQSNDFRKISIYACRLWSSGKLSALAKKYNCRSTSNISNVVSKLRNRLLKDKQLACVLQEIEVLCKDASVK